MNYQSTSTIDVSFPSSTLFQTPSKSQRHFDSLNIRKSLKITKFDDDIDELQEQQDKYQQQPQTTNQTLNPQNRQQGSGAAGYDSGMYMSPFSALEKQIYQSNQSDYNRYLSNNNTPATMQKLLKTHSTIIALPRQMPSPNYQSLQVRLFQIVVQLSMLIKLNHFNFDVIQQYYPLRELIKQESHIPKSELSLLKVNVLRLLKKNPQVEKQFKIWKQLAIFLNDLSCKWGLISPQKFSHRIDPKIQTVARVISYRNLNRYYIGLETLWLSSLTSPLKFVLTKQLSQKAVNLRTQFLQLALSLVNDYPNTSDLRKSVHDFQEFRFQKQASIIRNQNKESIVVKSQPILLPRKKNSYLRLNIQNAEEKSQIAMNKKCFRWFSRPNYRESQILIWKADLKQFIESLVEFEESFLLALVKLIEGKFKHRSTAATTIKNPYSNQSFSSTKIKKVNKYSIASRLGIKSQTAINEKQLKVQKLSDITQNQSVITPSDKIQSTPINLTPRSVEKQSLFGHHKQNSIAMSEDMNEELSKKFQQKVDDNQESSDDSQLRGFKSNKQDQLQNDEIELQHRVSSQKPIKQKNNQQRKNFPDQHLSPTNQEDQEYMNESQASFSSPSRQQLQRYQS